jgi:hypothetical protein
MKKIFLFPAILLVVLSVAAQNVGIGTTTPSRLLHIKGNSEVLRVQGSFPWIGFMNNTDADYGGFLYYPDTSLVMGSRFGTNQPLILAPNNNGLLFATAAQRVGIGNPAPAEKLDVTGNINVTGTIKANGVDGNPNQVLMKNSSGSMVWGDICEYKNITTFISGTGSWTVPAGVTKVWVEIWGGGAGGSWYGGGGGGGYASGMFEVTSGNSISYTVGSGGAGGTSTATNGGFSNINYAPLGLTLNALGGNAGSFIVSSIFSEGLGGGYSVTPGTFTAYMGLLGQPGAAALPNAFQYNSTTYIDYSTAGNGGDAGNTNRTGGKGGSYFVNNTTSTLIRSIIGSSGLRPGGGGGAGYVGIISLSGIGNSQGASGASGMVIIHF